MLLEIIHLEHDRQRRTSYVVRRYRTHRYRYTVTSRTTVSLTRVYYNVIDMAAERFFTKITQDVLDATERLANHLDDQFSQIFSGGSGNRTDENETGRDSSSADNNFNIIDDNEEEDVMAGSPLQGMADQVLNGIMDGQVGRSVVDLVGRHTFVAVVVCRRCLPQILF